MAYASIPLVEVNTSNPAASGFLRMVKHVRYRRQAVFFFWSLHLVLPVVSASCDDPAMDQKLSGLPRDPARGRTRSEHQGLGNFGMPKHGTSSFCAMVSPPFPGFQQTGRTIFSIPVCRIPTTRSFAFHGIEEDVDRRRAVHRRCVDQANSLLQYQWNWWGATSASPREFRHQPRHRILMCISCRAFGEAAANRGLCAATKMCP